MADQKFGFTEGLLITGVPALGYWLAFLYELGYCKYFNIPSTFIEIGILNILIAIVGTTALLAVLHLFADPFYVFFGKAPHAIKRALRMTFLPLGVCIGLVFVFKYSFLVAVIIVCVVGLPIALIEFVIPLVTQRGVQGYVAKLEAASNYDYEHNTSIMDTLAEKVGFKAFSLFFYLIIFSFVVYLAGGFNAQMKSDFMVLKGDPDMVVLKTYNSSLLATGFDRSSKNISAEFKMVAFDSSLELFTLERIGPLQVKSLHTKE